MAEENSYRYEAEIYTCHASAAVARKLETMERTPGADYAVSRLRPRTSRPPDASAAR